MIHTYNGSIDYQVYTTELADGIKESVIIINTKEFCDTPDMVTQEIDLFIELEQAIQIRNFIDEFIEENK